MTGHYQRVIGPVTRYRLVLTRGSHACPQAVQKTAGGEATDSASPPSSRKGQHAILAVNGCQPSTYWSLADVRESEWTFMDAPQTVLKTAGLSSATVHRHAYKFGNRHRQSVFIRSRLPRSAVLAVLLAVSDAARVVGHLIPQVHGSSPCASTKNVLSRCFKGTLPEG